MIQKHQINISDLEKEQYFNQERIKEAHINIDMCIVDISNTDSLKYTIR
jgi:5,10-methylene-tetrahydrofolate dehydrogenase/methenyl tetrahydrofolate cyclohydrolase